MHHDPSIPIFASTPRDDIGAHVSVARFDATHHRVEIGPHAHHDLELLYFERGGGSHTVGSTTWDVRDGDVFLVPPGLMHDLRGLAPEALAWALVFSPDAATGPDDMRRSLLLWRASPLLAPFLAAELDHEATRLSVVEQEREAWQARFERIRDELEQRRAGHRDAVAAHLLLVVVDVARLARDPAAIIRGVGDPVLADVLETIELRFAEGIGTADVARALGFTAGYLGTLVRARTGRTVQDWILERQMAEARALLLARGLSVREVAARVGFADAAYFSRRFRQVHGASPSSWASGSVEPP